MTRFLKLVSLFTLGFIIIVAIQASPTYYLLRSKQYTLPSNKTIFITGDSHTECAIDQTYLPNIMNCSMSGEPFLNSYHKISNVIRDNKNIDTILLGISPFHINPNSDYDRVDKFDEINRYFYLFTFNDFKEIGLHDDLFKWLKIINWIDIYTSPNILNALGRSLSLEERELAADIELHKKLKGTDSTFYGNRITCLYLDNIVKLCQSKNKKLIFISTPIYKAEAIYNTKYFYDFLSNNYPDIEFWDYTNFQVPDSCYANCNHLNRYGAEIFTQTLKKDKL